MRNRRRGWLLLDVAAAAVVAGMLLAVVLSAVLGLKTRQEASRRRQIARFEVANVMERLAGRPWASLAPAAETTQPLSEIAARELPGGRLTTRVESVAADAAARRIVVAVQWRGPEGEPESPIRLAAWVYRPGGTK